MSAATAVLDSTIRELIDELAAEKAPPIYTLSPEEARNTLLRRRRGCGEPTRGAPITPPLQHQAYVDSVAFSAHRVVTISATRGALQAGFRRFDCAERPTRDTRLRD